MHTNSLPPSDRDDSQPELATAAAVNDAPLHLQLKALADARGWSNHKLSKALGYSTSVISQYIGGKYPGDTGAVDRRVRDFIRNEERRRLAGVITTSCGVTRQMATALEIIRRTNDVGVVLAEAGEGKTRGIELYCDDNPLAVLFRVRSWSSDKLSIEGALMDAIGRAGYDNRTKRALWLAERMRGSGRLILVDDAHKLTRPALQWLFDFHDETLCPLALIGTYDLEAKVKDDAQRFSRVGYLHEIKPENPRDLIEHLVGTLAPGATHADRDELTGLCEQVAEQHGHFRAVFKELKLAAEIKEAKPSMGWAPAFKAAHQKLFREYKLN